MRLRHTLTIVMIVMMGGCASRNHSVWYESAAGVAPIALTNEYVVTAPLVPDLSLLRNITPATTEDITPISVLSEAEAQCLAAAQSVEANLLVDENAAVSEQDTGKHSAGSNAASELLAMYSVQERNEAAGDALEALYRLAEANSSIVTLDESLGELDGMLKDMDRVRNQGLPLPVTREQIEEQRSEMLHHRQEVMVATHQANRVLGQLLGSSAHARPRFWPSIDMKVTPEVLDPDLAVTIALTTRADLLTLRHASHVLSDDTLPAVRQSLAMAQTGLGQSLPTRSLLAGLRRSSNEVGVRSGQLQGMMLSQEQDIAQQVRLAVLIIDQRLEQIRLTDQRVEALASNLQILEQRRAIGQSTSLEIRQARLKVMAAKRDLLHDVIEWKIAVAGLKEAQGLLARECGYDPYSPLDTFCACSESDLLPFK